jgi:hypothetical protein
MNYVDLILVPIALSLSVFSFYIAFRKDKKTSREIDFKESDSKMMKKWEQQKELQEKIYKKSNKYIQLPSVSFHYANKDEIKNMYNEYFKEPTIQKVISEQVSKKGSKIKGNFHDVLSGEIGSNEIEKWISEIKLPDTSESGMFKRYQRETIKKEQVNICLEIIEAELFIIDEFDEQIKELNSKYKFDIDSQVVNTHRDKLREIACDKTIKKLENASGWVLIEGNFLIEKEGNDFYKLSMKHPVSELLPTTSSIHITCSIPINKIESSFSGNYNKSIGTSIPLNIYGKIWRPINLAQDIHELSITPLAVY